MPVFDKLFWTKINSTQLIRQKKYKVTSIKNKITCLNLFFNNFKLVTTLSLNSFLLLLEYHFFGRHEHVLYVLDRDFDTDLTSGFLKFCMRSQGVCKILLFDYKY
ncbi:hypothetical protein BpHYR1_043273 [Brachionus plicatilis]|uniref:Uncharacterized protein n=1 Tax=Brachionus plicatilis TaxID=10195 RepID=A0A3M7STI1_BRAPC|nr:hypothetical protein BpHYR1_043273 [Brachionus plicatilis]